MRRFANFSLVSFVYLFLYIPIFVLIVFSFNSRSFPAPWRAFTLDWYHELFRSSELWHAFFTSLFVATLSSILSLTLGALLIFFRSCGGKVGKFLPIFYGNLLIPDMVLGVGLLSYFTLFHIPLGLPSLIVSHSVIGLGFVVPILMTRYRNLDEKLKEVSFDLGATPLQTFFRITLPLLKPVMITTGILIFVLSFDDFILAFFCSGTKVQTLSLYLLSLLRGEISPVVNALSSIMFLLTGLLVTLFFIFNRKPRSRII